MLADLEEAWIEWILAGLAGLLSAAPAMAQFATPEAAVSALYARYKGEAMLQTAAQTCDVPCARVIFEVGQPDYG